jgi:hypothetical protein
MSNRDYIVLDIETAGLVTEDPLGLSSGDLLCVATGQDKPMYVPKIYCVCTHRFHCINHKQGSLHYTEGVRLWHGDLTASDSFMSTSALCELIDYLWDCRESCQVVTWNGLKFDFQVLSLALDHGPVDPAMVGQYRDKIRALCWDHMDLCFNFLVHNGFMISLQKTAEGFMSEVQKSGTGASVCELWRHVSERTHVLNYCCQDLLVLQSVLSHMMWQRHVAWVTKKGTTRKWVPTDHGHLFASVLQTSKHPPVRLPVRQGTFVQPTIEECTSWLSEC